MAGDEDRATRVRGRLERGRENIYTKLRYAVLNAISHEHAAVRSVFGEPQSVQSRDNPDVSIQYVEVTIASGNKVPVVLAGITSAGIAQAASSASQVKARCPFIEKIVMVGIAAGQPNLSDAEKDVRLGDIVVGHKIIQYDHIKRTDSGTELRGDAIAPGAASLLEKVAVLRSFQDFNPGKGRPRPWEKHIARAVAEVRSAERPPQEKDYLAPQRNYSKGLELQRTSDEPFVHVGTIGSASTLLKSRVYRDELHAKYNTIAYEMEGAGLAIAAGLSGIEYLMVRGICDYGDANKDDTWQTYASVIAASFALSLLESL